MNFKTGEYDWEYIMKVVACLKNLYMQKKNKKSQPSTYTALQMIAGTKYTNHKRPGDVFASKETSPFCINRKCTYTPYQ